MDCPDPLACVAQALSLGGTLLAAWQAFRASQLLKHVATLQRDRAPAPSANTTGGDNEIPLQDALNETAKALKKDASWSPWNHRLLISGIVLAVIGSLLSTYRAFSPLSG